MNEGGEDASLPVDEGGQVVVRHSGRFTSTDIHNAIFPEGVPRKVSIGDMKASIGKLVRGRHARGRY